MHEFSQGFEDHGNSTLHIASTCESVLADSEQEQKIDAFTVLEEIGNVLTWTKCSLFFCVRSVFLKAALTCYS
jgi:hypothetical protein